MGILLGLLTALTWGGADFLARFATRRIGTLRAMFYMQGIGFVLLTIFLPWLGGWGHLTDGSGWRPWAWGLLAGGINAFSTLALYRAFEIGKMSVVAPLSASYPALTLLLSRLSGEPLTGVRTAGIFCVLLGAIVVARGREGARCRGYRGNEPQRSRNRLGDSCGNRIRLPFLASGNADRAASGRHADGLDDSPDQCGRSRDFDSCRKATDAPAAG